MTLGCESRAMTERKNNCILLSHKKIGMCELIDWNGDSLKQTTERMIVIS